MEVLKYDHNYNDKFNGDCFLDIRFHNPELYKVGSVVEVDIPYLVYNLKCVISTVKMVSIIEITEAEALLGFNMSLEECQAHLYEMYCKEVNNWANANFAVMGLSYCEG